MGNEEKYRSELAWGLKLTVRSFDFDSGRKKLYPKYSIVDSGRTDLYTE